MFMTILGQMMGMSRMVHPRGIPPGSMNPYGADQFQQVSSSCCDFSKYHTTKLYLHVWAAIVQLVVFLEFSTYVTSCVLCCVRVK